MQQVSGSPDDDQTEKIKCIQDNQVEPRNTKTEKARNIFKYQETQEDKLAK